MTCCLHARRWALALAALLLAGACGPAAPTLESTAASPTQAAVATTPRPADSGTSNGRTGSVSIDDIGLTLTLPKGWRRIPHSGDDLDEILDALPPGTLPPGFEEQAASFLASGMKLFAVDTTKANRGANVNVLAMSSEVPLAQLRAMAEVGISQLGGVKDVRYRDVQVDGAAALRVDYTVVLKVSGKKRASKGTQLWVPWDGSTLAITITTPKGGQTADRDALVKSLRLD